MEQAPRTLKQIDEEIAELDKRLIELSERPGQTKIDEVLAIINILLKERKELSGEK